jgi:ubiquinone/menaquinone biosynthesis C-methylase UbiE
MMNWGCPRIEATPFQSLILKIMLLSSWIKPLASRDKLLYSILSLEMNEKTLTTHAAQRFYDRIGSRYDWLEFYEGRAKDRAFAALDLTRGQSLLSIGVGTGKELTRMIEIIKPGGAAFGLDISPVMLNLTRDRTTALVCQADARRLPYANHSFDRLYAGYVLDLLPYSDLPGLIVDFGRVLNSAGRLVILALTEGVDKPSRAMVAAWKGIFSLSPAMCGGCRPLQLLNLVRQAGFSQVEREVIVQLGVPSELIVATKN